MFTASAASAYLATLDFYTVEPWTSVNIHAGALGNVPTKAGNHLVNVNGGPTLYGFCVDPTYLTTGPATYDLLPIDPISRYAAAAWVLEMYHTGSSASAAAQIAVWELVWDWGTTKNFSAGNFQLLASTANYTSLFNDANGIYDDALAAFDAGISPSILNKYVFASSNGYGIQYQDFVIPDPVPIPGAVWLLGSGMLGLVAIRRRMRK